MEVINPPGKKLAKCTSVHCGTVSWWNEKRGGLDNRFGLFLPEFSFYFLLLLSLCTAFLSRSKFKNCETKSCSSLDNYLWPYSFRLKLRIALGYVLEKSPSFINSWITSHISLFGLFGKLRRLMKISISFQNVSYFWGSFFHNGSKKAKSLLNVSVTEKVNL